jgi:Concanavalin A-like lectin/glucanases superfamily/Domain of unknown function DUF11/IPT/TIG domain/Ig-like domain CHU_C associated/G8 domain
MIRGICRVVLFLMVAGALPAFAVNQSLRSDDWSDATMWSLGTVPSSTDDVKIMAGHTVNGDTAATVQTLEVEGTLDITAAQLNVDYTVILTGGGLISGTGTLFMAGNATALMGTGTISAPVTFGTGSRTVGAGSNILISGAVGVNGGVDNSGTISFTDAGGLAGTGTWTQNSTGVLKVTGAISVASFSASTTGNSVEYQGDAQQVRATTYYTLKGIGNSETRSLAGTVTVNGNMYVEGTFQDSGYQITGPGLGSGKTLQLAANATLQIGTNNGAQPSNGTSLPAFQTYTFDGTSTVEYAARANQSIAHQPVYGILTIAAYDSPPLTLSKDATGAITTTGDLNVVETGGSTLTFGSGGNIDIGGDLNGAGDINRNTDTVSLQGSNTLFTGTITPTYAITFTGANPQNVRATTYDHLTISKNAETATLAGAATASNLTITSGSFSDGNFTLTGGSGALNMSSGTIFRVKTTFPSYNTYVLDPASTVYYEADGTQQISIAPTYGIVVVTTDVTAATKSLAAAGTLQCSNLNILNGTAAVTLDLSGSSADVNGDVLGNGTLGLSGGTLFIDGDFTHTGTFVSTNSTVTFDGNGPQSVRATNYHNLTINKSAGSATLDGGTTHANGNVNVTAGTLNVADETLDIDGNLTIDGTVVLNTGRVDLDGNLITNGTFSGGGGELSLNGTTQTLSGSGSLSPFDLTLNNNGTTANINVVLGGSLEMNGLDITVPDPYYVSLTATSTIQRNCNCAIRGRLAWLLPAAAVRRFEIASDTGTYLPVELTSSTSATYSIKAYGTAHPVNTSGGLKQLSRYWDIDTASTATLDLEFFWNDNTDFNGNMLTFVPVYHNGTSFTLPGGFVDADNYSARVNGATTYDGTWTVGAASSFGSTSPSVGGFTPENGIAGTAVSVFGSNFTGADTVAFAGTPATSFTVVNDNEISTTVPNGAVTGAITVSHPSNGTGTSGESFTIVTPVTHTTVSTGDWHTASIWNTNTVPGIFDNAVVNHHITVNSFAEVQNVNLNANLGGSDTLKVNGLLNWNSGTISASIDIAPAATLDVTAGSSRALSGGSLSLQGTAELHATVLLQNGASFVPASVSVLEFHGDFDFKYDGTGAPPASMTLLGTIRKITGTGDSFIHCGSACSSTATIEPQTGAIDFSSGLMQNAGATMKFHISGTGVSQIGRVDVSGGSLSLGGAWEVVLGGGHIPQGGATYEVLTMNSFSGDFDNATITFSGSRTLTRSFPDSTRMLLTASGPTIANVTPNSGTVSGGTYVEINGTGLAGVTSVKFDGIAGTIIGSPTATLVKVRTPAHAVGSVDVTVDGIEPATLTSGFLYVNPACSAPSGILTWYRLEGNGADSAGNAPLTNNGGTSDPGKVGQALLFNGTNQYAAATDNNWLRPASFSLEGWVKFNSVPLGQYAMLFGKTAGTGTSESYGVSYKDGLLWFGVGTTGGITYQTVAFTPVIGTWHHIALTFSDAADDLRLYVDGQLAHNSTSFVNVTYDSHAFTIGTEYENESLAYFFPGVIDEVTLYNRQLTANDVLAIYDADTAGKCYPAVPTLLSINPTAGATAGGTGVNVYGSSLSSPTAVAFGGNAAQSFTGVSQSQVDAVTAPAAASTVNVQVDTAAGSGVLNNAFTFAAPATRTTAANGNWNDPATWTGNAVPNSFDTVEIYHTVTMNVPVTISAVKLYGGAITGSSTLTVVDTFEWTSGHLVDNSGLLVLQAGCTSTISGTSSRQLQRAVTNAGTLTITATGQIQHASTAFTNSGTFIVNGDIVWTQFGTGSFVNNSTGIFNLTGGTLATFTVPFTNQNEMNLGFNVLEVGGGFSTSDTVNVTSGVLRVSGSGSFSGAVNLSAGTALELTANTTTFLNTTVDGAGTVSIVGATLQLSGTESIDKINFGGGAITGTGTLSVHDSFDWSGGTITGTGTMTLLSSCTSTIHGTNSRQLQRAVTNAGTLTITATGQIQHASTAFTNSGTFTVNGNIVWTQFGTGSFTNDSAGIFNKSGGGTATFSVPFTNQNEMNLGFNTLEVSGGFSTTDTVNVTSGLLRVSNTGSFSGAVNLSAGTTFELTAGTTTFLNTTVDGPGTVLLAGATLQLSGTESIDNLNFGGGAITGTGSLSVHDSFDWSGGTITGTGSMTLLSSCTSTIQGTNSRPLQRSITNAGTLTHSAIGQIQHAAGTFTNTGTFNLTADATWTQFGAGAFVNDTTGVFDKNGGNGTSSFSVPFTNSNDVSISAGGTLLFSADFSNNDLVTMTGGILALTGGSGTSTGTFNLGAGTSVVWSGGTPTLNGATVSGAGLASLSGASLTITGTVNFDRLALSSGALDGAGTAQVNSSFIWSAGSLLGTSGSLVLGSSTLTTISGTSSRQLQRPVTNNGDVTLTATGQIQHAGSTFTNNDSFDMQADATWTNFGSASFINSSGATFSKSAGATAASWSVPFTNDNGGTAAFTSGGVNFSNTFINNGSVSVSGSSVAVAVTAGSGTSTGTFTLTSPGAFYFSGGTYTLDGAASSGTGFMIFDGASMTITNAVNIDNLTLGGGAIGGGGTLTINDAFMWTAGTLGGTPGTMNIGGGAVATISGTSSRALQRNVNNAGSVVLTATGQIQHASCTFTNNNEVDIRSDATWTNFGSAVIVNNGTLKRTTSSAIASINFAVDNSTGVIDVVKGTLSLGGLTSAAGSTLRFGIGGPAAGTDHGVLALGGSHSRAGSIDANITNGFVPHGGTTYPVITSAGSSGTFSNSTITTGGRTFDVAQNANNVVLTAGGPTVASVTPGSGTQYGGTSVVITGTGFSGTTPGEPFTGTVTFGSTNSATVTWNSSTQLTAVTPAVAPSTVNVFVTNADGQPGMLANGFTFIATTAPTITAIHPNTGNVAGGTRVIVEGTQLDTVTNVDFGTSAATIVTQTASQLELLSPAHAAGPVTVTVTNPAGIATASFTYDNTWDAGRDFSRTSNPNAPWSYGKKSGATFTALPYAQAYGAQWGWNDGPGFILPEVVSNFAGFGLNISSWTLPSLQLEMHPAGGGVESAVRWIAPSAGQWQIDGTFAGIDSGGSRAVSVEINDSDAFTTTLNGLSSQSNTLRRTLNAGDKVDFVVGDGGNGIANDATALDAVISPLTGPAVTVSSVSPNTGSIGGGQTVTITGSGFHAGAAVFFGTAAASGVTVNSTNQITCTTPAHAAGTVNVTVTHNDSADATLTNGYTFAVVADLAISKTASASIVPTNGTVQYEIEVFNGGPSNAASLVITDTLPAGTFVDEIFGGGWSCTDNITSVTCTLASLASGTTSGTITLILNTPATANPAMTNTAAVDSAEHDPNAANDTSSATVAVIVPAGSISVSSMADSGPGTLRQAIEDANNGLCAEPCAINFGNGGTITLLSELPAIDVAVNIDATGIAGYSGTPLVTLDGASCTSCDGIWLDGGASTVRGLSLINFNDALVLTGDGGHTVTANWIGVDPAGSAGPNLDGIYVDTSNNVIGGSAAADANVLSANDDAGIWIESFIVGISEGPVSQGLVLISGNQILGNYIGTNAANASAIGNGTYGIYLGTDTGSTKIESNVIAYNAQDGIYIAEGFAHDISENSIHSNGGIGINLASPFEPTANDGGDSDSGPNNLQNTPVIASATIFGSDLKVALSVDSASIGATQSVRIEVFESDTAGEGETFLGAQCVDGNNISTTVTVPAGAVVAGDEIVATATSQNGTCISNPSAGDGTSEFSAEVSAANCTPPNTTVSPSGSTTFCTGGSVTLNAPTILGYTYQWFESGTPINAATSFSLNVTAAGSYTVEVTNSSGCTAMSAATIVTVNPIPSAPAASNGGPYCEGATVQLNASFVSGATYAWTGPNGFTSSLQNPTIASATAAASGTYSVTVTVNGCTSSAASTGVIVNATPATPTASNGGPYCEGATIQLNAAFVSGASYAWTGPNGFTSSLQNPTLSATTAAAGTYSVTATINGCTSAASSTTVVVNATPSGLTASNTGAYCEGATIQLNASSIAGATYAWTGPNGFTASVQNPTIAGAALAHGGTYTVTAFVNGCASTSTSTTVVVNATPSTPTASNGGPYCEGATIQLNASTIAGASYAWTGPNGFTSTAQNPTLGATAAAAAVYTVTATVNGCTSAASTTTVVVNAPPSATTASNTGPYCENATIQLSATSVGGATYAWTGPNGFTSTLQNPTLPATLAAAGTYTVTTSANGCASASSSTNVIVNATPSTPAASNGGPYCEGATIQLTAATIAGASYAWTGPNGFTSTAQNPTLPATMAASGVYSVTATVGTCTSTSSTTSVAVNALPDATISAAASVCANTSTSATVPFVSGAAYAWSITNGTINSGNGTNTINFSVSNVSPVTLSVTVTENGCSSSDTHTLTVGAFTPTITASGPTTFCTPGSVTLTASAATSYQWFVDNAPINGETNASITVFGGGSYTVTATGAGGCSGTSAPVVVTIATPPAPPTASNGGPYCDGATIQLNASTIAGASYAWTGPNGFTSTAQNPALPASAATAGVYSVTATVNGCTTSASTTTVVVNAALDATISAATGVCANTSGNTAGAPFVSGATYAWSIANGTIDSGNGTNNITFSAATASPVTLSLTVTANGCSASDTHTVTVGAFTPTITPSGPTSFCEPGSVTLTSSAANSYQWHLDGAPINGANSQSLVVSASGSYTVTATASGGCTGTSAPAVVEVTPAAIANITAPSSVNAGASAQAEVLAQANATYDWNITNGTITAGESTNVVTFTAGSSGSVTLSVVVTVNGTCTDTSSVSISIAGTGTQQADFSVTKSAPSTVEVSSSLTYTIVVSNSGPAASSATIIDTFPAGITVNSVSDGPWTCTTSSAQMVCTGSLAAGGSNTIVVNTTSPGSVATITNNVTVDATLDDPNAANDFASATTEITAAPTLCPSVPPSLLSPANNATVTSPASFSWSGVDGATSYEVWISSGGTTSLAGTTGTTSLSHAVASGTHTWFVIARLGEGCSALTSASRTFIVEESSACGANGTPQLTAPSANTSTTSPVPFSWTAVPQAIGYRLWIIAEGGAPQDIGTTDGAITLTASVPAGTIGAFVDALFGGCPATRSATVTFEVTAPDPCASRTAATPSSPANNSTINSSSVEFSWGAANNATSYRLWASVDGGAAEVLGTTTETSLREVLERGEVIWWVESLYNGCASTESQRVRFLIPAVADCGTTKPELLAPAKNSTTSNASVTFAWSAVANAIGYELWLGAANGTPTLAGTTNAQTTSLTRNVSPGETEWFVRALVDRCPSRDSQASRFTYTPSDACAGNQRAALVAPFDGIESTSPVSFEWNGPANATKFELYVSRNDAAPALIATTTASSASNISLATGALSWFVRTYFGNDCSPLDSSPNDLTVIPTPAQCEELDAPFISAPGEISSGVPFLVQWNPIPGATAYQLQIADNADFENSENITFSGTSHDITRTNEGSAPLAVYARVRAVDSRCTPVPSVSLYGPTSAVFILPEETTTGTVPAGDENIVQYTIVLGPELAGQTFTAIPTQPWLTVTPASGVIPAGGITLIVAANTTGLPLGANVGAVSVSLSGGTLSSNGTTVTTPISISLVTPVAPTTKNTPPPDAMIIPAVASAAGIGAQFQSDVRVSNTSTQLVKYQLSFIPSGDAGITAGKQTTFSVEPGRTVALDDILKTWFGAGTSNSVGSLEIRPLTQTSSSLSSSAVGALANIVSFASSRTFNVTPNGTFGQYIPAVPFANFLGKTATQAFSDILSLQQISQSAKFRTNLGFVEGSGEKVDLLVKVFGANGSLLGSFPVNLNGGQHTQLNLNQKGFNVEDGRVEVQVVGGNGKITAYASVLDNATADAVLVTPVTLSQQGNTKWVIPGVADVATGFANWKSDMRVFNPSDQPVTVNAAFYSQNGGEPKVNTLTIEPGQVKQLDKVLPTLFNVTGDGGAVHLSTPTPSRLIATARTYNETSTGSYGLFASAVTPAEAVGVGSRPLQLLQVEESTRFRSNIGFAEVTGKPVTIEVSVVPPDAKFTAVAEIELSANEFRQIGSLLQTLGLGETHNARISVRAISGEGRATAYAAVIDMKTNDPTYVPAQ